MVLPRDQKRRDARRREEKYAQVRDGAQRGEETLVDNSRNAETSVIAWLWGRVWEKGGKKWAAADLFGRKLEENVTCAACPPGASCTWWCSLSDGSLETDRENNYTFIRLVSKQHIATSESR